MGDNKYEAFESLESEKIEFAAKLFKRVLASKDYQTTATKSVKLFADLLQHSPPFRKAIDKLAVSEFFVSDVLQKLDWKQLTGKDELNKLGLLVGLIGRLRLRYEMEFLIKKVDEEGLAYSLLPQRFPISKLFKVRGEKIRFSDAGLEARQMDLMERLTALRCIFDEIEIRDTTSGAALRNDLIEALSRMSSLSPTIIKYTNREGAKKLLVGIPENLDARTFLKEYGSKLSKIHRDFYKKGFQGKPKKKEFGARLSDIDLKKYEGKKFSLNKLSQMIGKEMGLSPATLIRWHKSSLKKIQRSAKK